MTRLLLSGYYGFDNSGDDAILRSMVDNLKLSGDYHITVLSKSPQDTAREYQVDSVDRFNIREVIDAMKECDVFVFGGGSLLQDVTSTRSLLYYLFVLNLAIRLNKKTFIFANGIGPIDKKLNRKLTRSILSKIDVITLRDQDSYDYVKELGVEGPEISITADPVFMIESADEDRIDQILEIEDIDLSQETLAISLRDWHRSKDLNLEVAEFVDQIHNMKVLLVPMHYPYDLEYLRVVKEKSQNPNIKILENQYKVEEVVGILKRCTMTMAMRLHGVIYSAVAHRPTIGLVYDPKVYGLCQELDIEEFVDVNHANSDDLLALYTNMVANIEDREERIVVAEKRQEERSRQTLKELKDLIDED